jgi:hypothetical protein
MTYAASRPAPRATASVAGAQVQQLEAEHRREAVRQKCHRLLAVQRRKADRDPAEDDLLRGIGFCGRCGEPSTGALPKAREAVA